jgi:hypothetical protein
MTKSEKELGSEGVAEVWEGCIHFSNAVSKKVVIQINGGGGGEEAKVDSFISKET